MRRRTLLGRLAGAGIVGLGGCVATGGGLSAGEYDVGMSTNAFLPERFETSVGTTVVWGNTSSRAHTVTAYAGAIPGGADYFASGGFEEEPAAREAWEHNAGTAGGNIYSGETYAHTVEVPGTYRYFCIPHEEQGMVGELVVTE